MQKLERILRGVNFQMIHISRMLSSQPCMWPVHPITYNADVQPIINPSPDSKLRMLRLWPKVPLFGSYAALPAPVPGTLLAWCAPLQTGASFQRVLLVRSLGTPPTSAPIIVSSWSLCLAGRSNWVHWLHSPERHSSPGIINFQRGLGNSERNIGPWRQWREGASMEWRWRVIRNWGN